MTDLPLSSVNLRIVAPLRVMRVVVEDDRCSTVSEFGSAEEVDSFGQSGYEQSVGEPDEISVLLD